MHTWPFRRISLERENYRNFPMDRVTSNSAYLAVQPTVARDAGRPRVTTGEGPWAILMSAFSPLEVAGATDYPRVFASAATAAAETAAAGMMITEMKMVQAAAEAVATTTEIDAAAAPPLT
jgi:hypothetical protein